AHGSPGSRPFADQDGPIKRARAYLSVSIEPELRELAREGLPHQPLRVAPTHQQAGRHASQKRGQIGIPERMQQANPQLASTLVELLELERHHGAVEGASRDGSPM